jgi:hypothetical protein
MSHWNEDARVSGVSQVRAATPADLSLRPKTIADLLDETFTVLRTRTRVLATVTAALTVPGAIVSALAATASGTERLGFDFSEGFGGNFLSSLANEGTVDDSRLPLVLLLGALSLLVAVIFLPLASAAVARITSASVLGRPVTADGVLRSLLPLWPALVIASITTFIAVGVAAVAVLTPIIVGGALAFLVLPALAIPVGILGAVPLLLVWIAFLVVIPVVAIEHSSGGSPFSIAFRALGRSWTLMSRRLWAYLVVAGGVAVVRTCIGLLLGLVLSGVAGLAESAGLGPVASLIDAASALLTSAIDTALAAIVATLIYFDARVRFEALDVQMLASEEPAVSAHQAASSQPVADVFGTGGSGDVFGTGGSGEVLGTGGPGEVLGTGGPGEVLGNGGPGDPSPGTGSNSPG